MEKSTLSMGLNSSQRLSLYSASSDLVYFDTWFGSNALLIYLNQWASEQYYVTAIINKSIVHTD